MNIRFLTLAQKEVDECVRWYDERADLGRGFLDELDRGVRLPRMPMPRRSESKPRQVGDSKNPPATAGGTDLTLDVAAVTRLLPLPVLY